MRARADRAFGYRRHAPTTKNQAMMVARTSHSRIALTHTAGRCANADVWKPAEPPGSISIQTMKPAKASRAAMPAMFALRSIARRSRR